jgi:hypothetical protein
MSPIEKHAGSQLTMLHHNCPPVSDHSKNQQKKQRRNDGHSHRSRALSIYSASSAIPL